MFRQFLLSFIIIFTLICVAKAAQPNELLVIPLQIETGDVVRTYHVETAVRFREQMKGLMGRDHLDSTGGMLFIFRKNSSPGFWMKNMEISIDMLFIGKDQKIKHIEKNVPPCPPQTKCPIFQPPTPIRYVLEVKSGTTDQLGLEVGDKVIFN